MQFEFSPPLTRLDVVLWFLRVQMWLSVIYLILGFVLPYGGMLGGASLQNLATSGVPILILSLFPRVLASTSLGSTARDTLKTSDFRALMGRCVGLTLFVHSLGSAILLTFGVAESFFSRGTFSFGGGSSFFFVASAVSTALTFFLGFALAFGPAIRDNFRAH